MNYDEFCKKYEIKLNDEQMAAVTKTEGPTLMISVPGSGKTTVIVARIGYMLLCAGIRASEILTVTFSVEAARSMKARFKAKFGDLEDEPEFRTVHSMSLNIIKEYCRKYHKKPHNILNSTEAVIRKIVENKTGRACGDDVVRDIVSHIGKAKNLMFGRAEIEAVELPKVRFSEVLDAYESFKKRNKVMDFDDIMLFALQILEKVPDILEDFQQKYRYFNVDEAQDNSLIQNRIMQILSSETNNLFMVGDEDQCIYGFRGAYPRSFFEFSERWGEENIIKLETNYRSCDAILRYAEGFISQNKNRYHKQLRGVKNKEGSVSVREFRTYLERNRYIAGDCLKYESAAVLARNNYSLVPLVHYLEKTGADYSIKAGKNDFFDGSPIMDIISIFEAALGLPADDMSPEVRGFLARQNPGRLGHIKNLGGIDAVRFVVDEMHYDRFLISRCGDGIYLQGILSRLNILESVAADCEDAAEVVTMVRRLREICQEGRTAGGHDSERSGDNSARAGGPVSLLTCHGSKGLEFDKVYIIDVTEGVFPACSPGDDEYEEEVRLFYVAVTRAIEACEVINVKSAYYGKSLGSEFVESLRKVKSEK